MGGQVAKSLRLLALQTAEQRREHFEIERELRERLLAAPDTAGRRRLYGEVYAEFNSRVPHNPLASEAGDPAARETAVCRQARLLRPFLKPDSVFLEIGAHDGALAKAAAADVRESIAIDVHDEAALAGERNYRFTVFDGFNIELEDDSVDLAYSRDVAEHLHPDDFADQAREIRRVLRPGGKYVCVTPNRLSGPHDVSGHFSDVPEGFHLREYTDSELAVAFRAVGFRQAQLLVSYYGYWLAPLLPVPTVRPVELAFERLGGTRRRRYGAALSAVKVVVTA